MFVFYNVFLFTYWSRVPAAHCMAEPLEWNLRRTASLQQFHFAHWLLSWVLCDCNWLESLKLASPCQPMKALKSQGLIQLSSLLKPNGLQGWEPPEQWASQFRLYPFTIHHPPQGLVLDGAFVWALSFPALKLIAGWTDFGLTNADGRHWEVRANGKKSEVDDQGNREEGEREERT